MARTSKLTYTVGSAYFTNINSAAIKMGGKVTNQDYVSKDGVISYTYPVINAIDIDWNTAYLANHGAYIRHSGDLLDFIDNLKTSGVDHNEIIQIINDTIPDSLSYFNNDVGYITAAALRNYVTEDDIRNNETLRGLSAYQIAQQVYEQSGRIFPYANESEWIDSLRGKDGSGDGSSQSITYISELINNVGYITAAALRNYVTEDDIRNNDTLRGLSAYQIAQQVYEQSGRIFPYATESEWIDSLHGETPDIDDIMWRIEELSRLTSYTTSINIDSQHEGLSLSYEVDESYNTISYVIGLDKDFLPIDTFNDVYEQLYNPSSYSSISYIARDVLAYELIPAYANETLDTLEEISYWIQTHPDEYNYVLSNIDMLNDNISYFKDQLDDSIVNSLAYKVAQLDIEKLITVKVDAEANKIETITVNNELQDIYELDDNHKKNVNINIPIKSIYDNNTKKFAYINTNTNTAYIDEHVYDTDDIKTTDPEFATYNQTTGEYHHMSLTDALSILNTLSKSANEKIDNIINGNSGVNTIQSDGSLLINGDSVAASGDVTISATGKTIPIGYDLTTKLGASATPKMSMTDALSILAGLQKQTSEKVSNHEERITNLEENISYISWQIIN